MKNRDDVIDFDADFPIFIFPRITAFTTGWGSANGEFPFDKNSRVDKCKHNTGLTSVFETLRIPYKVEKTSGDIHYEFCSGSYLPPYKRLRDVYSNFTTDSDVIPLNIGRFLVVVDHLNGLNKLRSIIDLDPFHVSRFFRAIFYHDHQSEHVKLDSFTGLFREVWRSAEIEDDVEPLFHKILSSKFDEVLHGYFSRFLCSQGLKEFEYRLKSPANQRQLKSLLIQFCSWLYMRVVVTKRLKDREVNEFGRLDPLSRPISSMRYIYPFYHEALQQKLVLSKMLTENPFSFPPMSFEDFSKIFEKVRLNSQ